MREMAYITALFVLRFPFAEITGACAGGGKGREGKGMRVRTEPCGRDFGERTSNAHNCNPTSQCLALVHTHQGDLDGLNLTWVDALHVGEELYNTLLLSRHRGVVEVTSSSFQAICSRYWE